MRYVPLRSALEKLGPRPRRQRSPSSAEIGLQRQRRKRGLTSYRSVTGPGHDTVVFALTKPMDGNGNERPQARPAYAR